MEQSDLKVHGQKFFLQKKEGGTEAGVYGDTSEGRQGAETAQRAKKRYPTAAIPFPGVPCGRRC